MTQALIEIQRVLSEANAAGKLTDTIWRGPAETLFDYIQNEIDAAGTTGCTDQPQIAEPEKFTVDSEMSRAFEIEYGQDWKDPDWRRETGVWASAWHKATNAARAAAPQAVQPAIMPKGESAAAQLRAMATNYPAGHSWDKLDARACIRGALEIEALRALLAAAPAHPAEGVPTSSDLRERLARLEAGCNAHTTPTVYEAIADSKAALDELDEARQRVGISLAATQPAAQAVPVLYVSKGQLDNHRDPDGVDTDGAGRYLPARKTPKGNFTAPLYERPAPAAQGLDAQQYRLIDHGELIEAGDEFLMDDFMTWEIDPKGIFVGTPLGIAFRPARRAIAAQAKHGVPDDQ